MLLKQFGPLLLKCVHNKIGRLDSAHTIRLTADKAILTALLVLFLQLLVDRQYTCIKINAIPRKPENFTLAKAGKEVDFIKTPKWMPFDLSKKRFYVIFLKEG